MMNSSPITNAEETLVMALHELQPMLQNLMAAGSAGLHEVTKPLPEGSISTLRSSNGALILQLNAVVHEPEPEKENQSA